jgi:endonuclease/exonuclease/phosphatase (EEP) superfamily protein YafD
VTAGMPLEVLAWATTAVIGALTLSQAFGATWHPIFYVLQAFTVHAGVVAFVMTVSAAVLGRPLLAVVDGVLVVALVLVMAPVVARLRADPPVATSGTSVLSVLHANTYYDNDRVERAADAIANAAIEQDVDVIVVTEYSLDLEAVLTARLGGRFPFTAGAASDERNGLGLLSRSPLDDVTFGPYRWMPGLELTVRNVRLLAVHPETGVSGDDLVRWRDDLEHIGERATSPGPPTVVVGDFNAARWHPPFRHLLDRGLVDAHDRLGRGFSTSWPVDWWRPRFVRLDHALVDDRLVPLSVSDFRIPGSDHTGFVVAVGLSADRAGRPAP